MARKEFNGLDDAVGIGTLRAGKQFEHPTIAGLLFGTPKAPADPPHQRVPPQRCGHGELDPTDPRIATLEMRQFVCNQRVRFVRGEAVQEVAERSKFDIPQMLVESVAHQIFLEEAGFWHRMGMSQEEILKRREEFRDQMRERAIDQVKTLKVIEAIQER
ncbi:MAG: hypothetical protein IH848_05680 [Acidobacteria bacterium]|nr:hypothetical protein [Acidobacteriota bacterium]